MGSVRMRLHVLACFLTNYMKGVSLSCCTNKLVGDIHYTLIEESPEIAEPLQCLDSCIYERQDSPGTKYCFTSGSLPTFCTDSSSSTSSLTTPSTTPSGTSQGSDDAVVTRV